MIKFLLTIFLVLISIKSIEADQVAPTIDPNYYNSTLKNETTSTPAANVPTTTTTLTEATTCKRSCKISRVEQILL